MQITLGRLRRVLIEVAPEQDSGARRAATPAKARWPCFLALPALFVLLHVLFVRAQGPFFLGSNIDPDYSYLFNSLNIATGKAPFHVDHPGTTVQLLGAVVLRAAYPFSSRDEMVTAVVNDPERHLHWINFALASLYAVSLFVIGVLVWRRSGRWLPAVMLQAAPLLLADQFRAFARVNPEPMLLLAGMLMAALLYLHSLRETSGYGAVLGLGLAAAFGIVTKVSFVPLLLAALPCLRSWKQRAGYLACVGAFTCLWLIPLGSQAARHISWVKKLIVHEGLYGQGGTGFVPPEYFSYLARLFSDKPGTCALVAASWGLAVYGLRQRRTPPSAQTRRWLLLMAGLAAGQTVQMLWVVKFATWRYLIPTLAFAPLNLLLLLELTRSIWGNRSWWPRLRRASPACAAAGLIIVGVELGEQHETLSERRADRMRMARALQEQFKDQTQAYYWGASSIYHGLWFGNHWAGRHYTPALKEVFKSHPRAYLADQQTGWLYFLGEMKSSIAQLAPEHPPLILVGAARLAPMMLSRLPPHAKAEKLFQSGQEVLHRVTFGAK